jgi:hypothetical protein
VDAKEKRRLAKLLDELADAIEELLLSGTTAVSKTTRDKLAIGFKEASRAKLLRLGSTIRIALTELERLSQEGDAFAPDRLAFFLDRAWLMSRGFAKALHEDDHEAFERLNFTPQNVPVERVELVNLGVFRRVTPTFAAFEMRLRVLSASTEVEPGQAVVWSIVFPVKPGVEVPPEAFLALEQKQKFRPTQLLEKKTIEATDVTIARGSPTRVLLGPDSRLTLGDEIEDWSAYRGWDRAAALDRIEAHVPDPMALPVEFAEEVVLDDWALGAFEDVGKPYEVADVESEGFAVSLRVDDDTPHAKAALKKAAKRKRGKPALFGSVHYELGRAVMTPLSLLGEDGPDYLTIAEANVDKAALVRALKIR